MRNNEKIIVAKPVPLRPFTSQRSFPNLTANQHSSTTVPVPNPTFIIKPKSVRLKTLVKDSQLDYAIVQDETMHQSNSAHAQPELVHQDIEQELDKTSYDGYNWRKYGQKLVKGSNNPRSYYKCTHPACLVKKIVEATFDGKTTEIVFKGEHNHPKTKTYKDHSDKLFEGNSNHHLTKNCDMDDDLPKSRKKRCNSNGLVESSIEPQLSKDGFRWRKYGQKIVKGSSYPRSYFKCSDKKCKVRKHVERALDDPKSFITTYEGTHNHEMPDKAIDSTTTSDADTIMIHSDF